MANSIQKQYKSPVTIIIGIKCRKPCGEGIIIVCDSRTTKQNGYCDDKADKLSVVKFRDGNSAIIAEAGNADFSGKAVELFMNLAATEDFTDYRSSAECLAAAIDKLKQKIRDQQRGASPEFLTKYFSDHSFELMLAYYWNNEPHIFTFQFEDGTPCKLKKDYTAIGCGCNLADFIINRVEMPNGYDTAAAIWLGAYAVEEIKKLDARCGGQTRNGTIVFENGKSVSTASKYDCPAMAEVIKEATEFADMQSESWGPMIHGRIQEVIRRKKEKGS